MNIIEKVDRPKRKKYDEDVKKYTKKELDQHKKDAKAYYQLHHGEVSVKMLSRVGKVTQTLIRQWMAEENWDTFKEDPEDKVRLSDKTKQILRSSAEEHGLNEQEEIFCYHYLKTFNATTSAIKAGYSSSFGHQKANLLLKEDKIKKFIDLIKGQRNAELFIDSMRIIQEYLKIAFADMTDFVKFGPDGVSLRYSDRVDGQMIIKVKEGRDGVSIELADKLKALDKLDKYLSVMPTDWRQTLEEKKFVLMQEKLDMEKQKMRLGLPDETVDDGFIEALNSSAKDAWSDEDE